VSTPSPTPSEIAAACTTAYVIEPERPDVLRLVAAYLHDAPQGQRLPLAMAVIDRLAADAARMQAAATAALLAPLDES